MFLRLVSIPGDESRTCFSGVIIDDLVGGEGTESFTLVIGEPTQPGVNLGLDETTINIIDDDSMCNKYVSISNKYILCISIHNDCM